MRVPAILGVVLSASCLAAQDGWRLETGAAAWSPRDSHTVAAFNGRLWVLSGSMGVQGACTDVWSSSDGVSWNEEVQALPWGSRDGATVEVFNGRLWLLGGNKSNIYRNEVWSSADGVNWTWEVFNAPWTGRAYHTSAVFNGKLWVFGGWTLEPGVGYFALNDVWSSPDGRNWTQEVAAAGWSARSAHSSAVFDGRLWVFGGADGQLRNDVWSSVDGINWVQETAAAPWAPRSLHSALVFNKRLWVLGGSDGNHYNDVWSSTDGVTWVNEMLDAPWAARRQAACLWWNDRLWLLGGGAIAVGYMNDVWSFGMYIAPTALPDAIEGEAYGADLGVKEGTGPYAWTMTGGSLPPGLALGGSTTELVPVTGTPTALGKYAFTIKVVDGTGKEDEQEISLTVTKIEQKTASPGPNPGSCTQVVGAGLPAAPLAATLAATLFALASRRRRR